MKIKQSFVTYFAAWSVIVAVGLMLNYIMLDCWLLGLSEYENSPEAYMIFQFSWRLFLTLFGLICLGGLISSYRSFRLKSALDKAALYAQELTDDDDEQPLDERRVPRSVRGLFFTLNFLRDRQQKLASKLRLSITREAEVRREIEEYDLLQLKIIMRLLPEMRLPLSAIKGHCMALLQDIEDDKFNREEVIATLTEVNHKVAMLSRNIERISDIGALDRERWNKLTLSDFSTAEFMRELTAFNLITLREREIALVNHFAASTPEFLHLDRELLMQLGTLLIRAVGRSAAAGDTIVLSFFCRDDRVCMEVHDSHFGQPRDNIAEALVAYERSGESRFATTENISLNVLGMIFVREIATKLGAKLEVSSDDEAFLRLRLLMPDDCVQAGAEQLSGRAKSIRPAVFSELAAPKTGEKTEWIKCVYAGRSTDTPKFIGRILAHDKIEVVCVENDQKLDEMLSRNEPIDAFILSVSLGTDLINRIEKIRAIRSHHESPIVVTGTGFSPTMLRQFSQSNRVYPMSVPANFTLLAQALREGRDKK